MLGVSWSFLPAVSLKVCPGIVTIWNSEKRRKQKYFKFPKLSLLEMLLAASEKLEGEEMVEYFQAQGTLPRAVAGGKYSCKQQEGEPEIERKIK